MSQFTGDWDNILQQDQHKLPLLLLPRKASSAKPVPKCCLTGTLSLPDYSHFCMKACSKVALTKTCHTGGWVTVETHFSPSQCPKVSLTHSLTSRFVFWTLLNPSQKFNLKNLWWSNSINTKAWLKWIQFTHNEAATSTCSAAFTQIWA